MQIPGDLRYAENHEWARLEADGTVRVGISDFAQDQLGDIVFVDLPEVGRTLEFGESFGEVESTKSVSEVYSPIAGTITAVNNELLDAPEAINTDPYGDGWLIVIASSEGASLDALMDAAAYASVAE